MKFAFTHLLCHHNKLVFTKITSGAACQKKTKKFELSLDLPLHSGWYLIKPQKDNTGSEACLLLDFGGGYEKAYKIQLNCAHGVVSSSVAELPAGVKKIQLLLKSEEKEREQSQVLFHFTPVSKLEAVCRIAFYLYRLNKMRGISTSQVISEKIHQIRKQGVINIIKNLGRFYDYSDTERPLGYEQWIQRNERLDAAARKHIQNSILNRSPLISIVCPIDDSLTPLLSTIDSLYQQVYKKWQLIVVANDKKHHDIIRHIQEICSHDRRIRLSFAEFDGALVNVNTHFPVLSGEFVLKMTVGDRLSPYALYHWAEAINRQSEIVAWYCDSDFINSVGLRHNPHFRPDWNQELFYSQDYIGECCLFHLPTIRQHINSEELTKITSQYELLLRILENIENGRIGHIAKVLYHQTDANRHLGLNKRIEEEKHRALRSHFANLGKKVTVLVKLLPYIHRINYPLPSNNIPSVSIITPTRDQVHILKRCIKSIVQRTEFSQYEIVVVDNDSKELATKRYLETIQDKYGIRIVLYDKPFNFAAINNLAVSSTDKDMICLLNNDIEIISPDWIECMIRYAVQPEIGCVGAKLLYRNGTVQHAGVICGLGDVAGHAHRYLKRDAPGYFGRLQSAQYYSAVTAACLLVRRNVWNEVGGFNEELAVAYNDIDFCLRVKEAGYKNVYTPYAELYHHESLSRGPEDTPEKRERYEREKEYMWEHWQEQLDNDECYNPNLSRLREDFSL